MENNRQAATPLNTLAATPLYVQIADVLASRIISGELQPGESIGSQRQLEEEFAVSLVTIRQALSLLKERELIVSRQGKGFFVKDRGMVPVPLPIVANLSAVLAAQGRTVTVDVRLFEICRTSDEAAQTLGLVPGTKALHVHRLHLLDSQPVALADIWGHPAYTEHLTAEDHTGIDISAVIEQKVAVGFGASEQTIRAIQASRRIARLLEIKIGSPLLLTRRVLRTTSGSPVFYISHYYRSDIFEFRAQLTRATLAESWDIR